MCPKRDQFWTSKTKDKPDIDIIYIQAKMWDVTVFIKTEKSDFYFQSKVRKLM